jgi:hypothetical protein
MANSDLIEVSRFGKRVFPAGRLQGCEVLSVGNADAILFFDSRNGF